VSRCLCARCTAGGEEDDSKQQPVRGSARLRP
jgi:hypothetical protein